MLSTVDTSSYYTVTLSVCLCSCFAASGFSKSRSEFAQGHVGRARSAAGYDVFHKYQDP